MKKILLSLLAIIFAVNLFSQSTPARDEVDVQFAPDGNQFKTAVMAIPIDNDGPFLSYYVKSNEPLNGLSIRFSTDGNNWSDWQVLKPEPHMQFEDNSWISELGFEESGASLFQISSPVNYAAVNCSFFNPKHTEEIRLDQQDNEDEVDYRSCPCPAPDILSRSQWCPDGTCYPHPSPSYTNVTHLIIHHSAGTNTSSDWAGVVRAIWDFHVNGNGWSDIGYNWLIDPNGVVYEGRGDNILGAHFCGTNGGTAGTCVMGNFTDIEPTDEAIGSLIDLYTWKACDKNLNPMGSGYHNSSGLNLERVSGHQDGCATACPGDSFYPMLDDIRQQMFDHIVAGCEGLAGPTGLTGTLTEATEATLNWTDNSEDELGFLLERMGGGVNTFEQIAVIDADITEYVDNTIDAVTEYSYRLRSYSDADSSAYSNIAVVNDNVATDNPYVNGTTVSLFPNPVKDQLNIEINNELSGKVNIKIFDLLSKSVQQDHSFEKTVSNQHFKLESLDLPAGIYLLNIQQGEHSGLFRFVIE